MVEGVQILTSSPFRTGSVLWQEAPGQWTLTIACKATYALAPVVSPLADEPDDVQERDNHWDDDPRRSLYLPSDLAPLKPEPEVMLVGSAFAPRGEPVRSIHARILVGDLDKSIEIHGPRTFLPDGTLQEGSPWTQMPLRYERAAGGEGSWNPVGLPNDVVDRYGRRALPNLQPPGMLVSQASDVVAAIGFGPIAPSWPGRRDKLRDRAATFPDRWASEPLGEGFDASYFQAAPLDQRVTELRADEQIILENLLPDHARLVTKLPGVMPRVRVETSDMPAWDLLLVADTLWIDTQRAICTLVWRGQVPLADRDQPGFVRIGVEEPGRAVRWPSSDPPPDDRTHPDFSHTATDDQEIQSIAGRPKPVLPFQDARGPRPIARLAGAMTPQKPIVTPRQKLPELWAPEDPTETMKNVAAQPRGATPTWLDLGGAPASAPAPQRPPPPNIPPPIPTMLRSAEPVVSPPVASPPAPPAPRVAPPPDPPPSLRPDDKTLAGATYAGVLEASNAAADAHQPLRGRPTLHSEPPVSLSPRPLVELFWHDATKVDRMRQTEAWKPLLRPAPAPPPTPDTDPEAAARAAEAKARAGRADIAAVLTRATPVVDVEGALIDAASEDGDIDPPLVVVAGEIELGLDEVKMLEAMLGAAASFAAGDKKLKEVIDLASEVMRTPLGASPGVAAGFVARVREAWVKSHRLLPADYLDIHTRRLLLEQRSYQKRELWGDTYLRALIAPSGEGSGIPVYLPAPIAKQLPLFARFPARVIAEAFPQQDQLEAHPVALRVTALARVVPGRARHR